MDALDRKQTIMFLGMHSIAFIDSLMVRQTTVDPLQAKLLCGPIPVQGPPEDVDPRRLPWPSFRNIDVLLK